MRRSGSRTIVASSRTPRRCSSCRPYHDGEPGDPALRVGRCGGWSRWEKGPPSGSSISSTSCAAWATRRHHGHHEQSYARTASTAQLAISPSSAAHGNRANHRPVVGSVSPTSRPQALLVDGIDGRIHYAETGKLAGHDMPNRRWSRCRAVAAKARCAMCGRGRVPGRAARNRRGHDLARPNHRTTKPVIHDKGFGADVSKSPYRPRVADP